MINNKGQSFLIFILILPIVVFAFLVAIQKAIFINEKINNDNITKMIIKNCIDECSKDDIINLYNKNNIIVEDIIINNEDGLTIKGKYIVKKVMDINNEINFSIKGKIENNKIVYNKGY